MQSNLLMIGMGNTLSVLEEHSRRIWYCNDDSESYDRPHLFRHEYTFATDAVGDGVGIDVNTDGGIDSVLLLLSIGVKFNVQLSMRKSNINRF